MKKELDEKLCEKYPRIFADRHADLRSTAMCWGFECGDGWYNIIDLLCSSIQSHVDRKNRERHRSIKYNQMIESVNRGEMEEFEEYTRYFSSSMKENLLNRIKSGEEKGRNLEEEFPQIIASQIKEKFGTLCFYTNFSDEYIYGAISMAERMSGVTCEECGKPGKLFTNGWWHVACEDHKRDGDEESDENDSGV